MHKYFPSKKFILVIFSIIVAIGLVLSFNLFKRDNSDQIKSLNFESQTKIQEFIALDSDGDKLPDWEEALWKTDPNKTDTDGDGTSDSEEITANRDPLKTNTAKAEKEPNDKISPEIIAADKKAVDDFNSLTTTEKMGRLLLSQYVATRKIDTPLTETDKLQIVENTIVNMPPTVFKIYSEKEILINDFTDNEALKKYSNEVAGIILTNLQTPTEKIDNIINDFANITNDAQITEQTQIIFKRFDPLITRSQKTVLSLLKVNVPRVFLNEHLSILNSFQEIYQSLDIMKKSGKDIITIIPVLNHYSTSSQNLADSLVNLIKKISTLKVIYATKNDYGYQLFNVIMFKN